MGLGMTGCLAINLLRQKVSALAILLDPDLEFWKLRTEAKVEKICHVHESFSGRRLSDHTRIDVAKHTAACIHGRFYRDFRDSPSAIHDPTSRAGE